VTALAANGTVTLVSGTQSVFSAPFNIVIVSIYMTVGVLVDFTFPTGLTVYPYVELFVASSESNVFSPIPQTRTMLSKGYSGTILSSTMHAASTKQIGLTLPAGMRILIGGGIVITGTVNLARSYYIYYTGGIGLRQA
jgi:hypothetical protein